MHACSLVAARALTELHFVDYSGSMSVDQVCACVCVCLWAAAAPCQLTKCVVVYGAIYVAACVRCSCITPAPCQETRYMFVSFGVFAWVLLRVCVCVCVVRVRERVRERVHERVRVVLYYFRSTAVDSGMYVCICACSWITPVASCHVSRPGLI